MTARRGKEGVLVLILDCPKNKIHLLHSNLMVVSQQVQGQNMSLSLLSWKLRRLDYSSLTGWLQNHAKLYYRIRRIYSCLLQIVQVVSNHTVTLLFYSIIEYFDTVTQTCLSQNSRSGIVDLLKQDMWYLKYSKHSIIFVKLYSCNCLKAILSFFFTPWAFKRSREKATYQQLHNKGDSSIQFLITAHHPRSYNQQVLATLTNTEKI